MDAKARQQAVQALRAAAATLMADFAQVPHDKDKWVRLTPADLRADPSLADELFDLIQNAYRPIGGHFKLKTPASLMGGEITFYDVMDVDSDSHADAVQLSKKKPPGEKEVGMGHDGTRPAKDAIMTRKGEMLKKRGVYGEVSDALAHILLTRYDVPVVTDEDTVRKVLKGKDIEWVGAHPSGKYPGKDGWYKRGIGAHHHMKIMVGRPKA